jgi:hypothetical protein
MNPTEIKRGVKQETPLLLALFEFYINYLLKTLKQKNSESMDDNGMEPKGYCLN